MTTNTEHGIRYWSASSERERRVQAALVMLFDMKNVSLTESQIQRALSKILAAKVIGEDSKYSWMSLERMQDEWESLWRRIKGDVWKIALHSLQGDFGGFIERYNSFYHYPETKCGIDCLECGMYSVCPTFEQETIDVKS
jgi:hypothetical protein